MKKLTKPAKVTFLTPWHTKDFLFGSASDVAADFAKVIAAGNVTKVISFRPAVGSSAIPAHYFLRKAA